MKTLVASFGTQDALRHALPRLRELGSVETYTPQMLEDEEETSILPLVVLIGGVIGLAVGFGIQTYANVIGYPVDIGGRPEFSWPAFVPITFEIGVLTAIFAGFIGYFVVNRLPHLYDPIDEATFIRGASRDLWCVSIETEKPDQALHLLRSLSAEAVEEVPA
jgi:hypothetical protein